MSAEGRRDGFDGAAAVTRSLVGYGVLSGVFYLVVGVILGVTRDGFDFSRHALSLLTLGDHGWMQRTNLIIAGAMVIAAAVGFARALRGARSAARVGSLLSFYGACLIGSGIFIPDPMAGFPKGTTEGQASVSGVLHLTFGAIGFLCLAGAAFVLASWYTEQGDRRLATRSKVASVMILVGFLAGAVLAAQTAGVVLLWFAVVAGWTWLAAVSIDIYKRVPHPLLSRRLAPQA